VIRASSLPPLAFVIRRPRPTLRVAPGAPGFRAQLSGRFNAQTTERSEFDSRAQDRGAICQKMKMTN